MHQPALARADTGQSAACRRAERAGLLITGGIRHARIPDMPPGRKSFGDIRLKAQDHKAACGSRTDHQKQLRELAAAQERNHQKGHEEDRRCSEVAHQSQTAKAERCKPHENPKILFFK